MLSKPARPWLIAWVGGPLIGIANGVVRERLYAPRLGEHRAHQVSTASAIVVFTLYFAALQRRWPLPSNRVALEVGRTWAALTMIFEFGFGHFIAGQPWSELAKDYNLRQGRLWPLVLAWLALGPATARALDPS